MKRFARFLFVCLFGVGGLNAEAPHWPSMLHPLGVGSHPEIAPFEATFAFGWSGIQAATGEASLTYEGANYRVKATGRTEGLAAQLWRMQLDSQILAKREQFTSISLFQREQYSSYRLEMTGKFQTDGVWSERLRIPSSDPGRWRFMRVAPIRDMMSAMLFMRSQPLATGDETALVAFPGDSPYLVRMKVEGRESIRLMNEMRSAIRVRLFLQKIEVSGPNKGKLQDHTKFRSGVVWVSDDGNRFPLRAEVTLFIGYVYAELTGLKFNP